MLHSRMDRMGIIEASFFLRHHSGFRGGWTMHFACVVSIDTLIRYVHRARSHSRPLLCSLVRRRRCAAAALAGASAAKTGGMKSIFST